MCWLTEPEETVDNNQQTRRLQFVSEADRTVKRFFDHSRSKIITSAKEIMFLSLFFC